MATQAYPYMVLTDGTTTVTHQDGSGGATNYPLVRDGWAPAIAGLRASPLAGYTPYEDVVETYTIEINGATATAALANLATLTRLLDQAARWYRGENATAVLMKIAPHGSTVSSTAAPLQAAVLGGGVSGPAGVRLSPRWDEVGRNFVIPDVQVTLVRRGLWLHTTTEAHSPSAADNGELVTFTLTARDTPSPTKIQFTNFAVGAASFYLPGGFVIVGEPVGGSASIDIENAEGATATGYTSVSGAALNARNNNVLRYTPTNTTEVQSGTVSPTLPATTRLVAVFANVRPSATVTFTVRARLFSNVNGQYTPHVVIAPDTDQTPVWVFLGVTAVSGALSSARLYCTANSATSNLDIDTLVFCDAEACQVVAFGSARETSSTFHFNDDVDTAIIDHQLLSKPAPAFTLASVPMITKGDMVITTKAASVYGLLLGTGGGSTSGGQEYRQADSGDAVLQNTWTATRHTAYLVPQ